MIHPFTMRTALCLLLLAFGVPAAFAQDSSEEKSVEERREEARVERLWNLNWRAFVTKFLEHEGEFICVPGYDRRIPSSTGQSINDYRSESAWQQTYKDDRGREQSRKLIKPEEDAFAAVGLIPDVEVGQYGYIHSGLIDEIIDDKTVELDDIWLVDADAVREEKKEVKEKLRGKVVEDIEDAIRDRFRGRGGRSSQRLAENEAIDWSYESREEAMGKQRASEFSRYTWVVKGFATGSLKEDARWPSAKAKDPGLQLIVVEVDGRTVTAVPAASLRKGITELQFIDYLKSRELSKATFVEMVTEAKREARAAYVDVVLAQLEGNQPSVQEQGGGNDTVELAD